MSFAGQCFNQILRALLKILVFHRDEADAYMYRLKKKQPLQNAARNSVSAFLLFGTFSISQFQCLTAQTFLVARKDV